jgi:hypothetical protein
MMIESAATFETRGMGREKGLRAFDEYSALRSTTVRGAA